MTTEEFSREFDILYNNIQSDIAPSINEYEKSIFLTQAQEAVVEGLYRGTIDSFETTEGVTQKLKNLVETTKPSVVQADTVDAKSVCYKIPDDLMYIIYETCHLETGVCDNISGGIIPTTHAYFYRAKNNPFRGGSKSRVLRLIHKDFIELYSTSKIKDYTIRYIKYPKPIILIDLASEGLSISSGGNTYDRVTECELSESLHRNILQLAVSMAKASWMSGNNNN